MERFCHAPQLLNVCDRFGVMLDDVLPDVGTEAAKRDHEYLFKGNVQLFRYLLDGGEEVVGGFRWLLTHFPQIGSTLPGSRGSAAIAVDEGASHFGEVTHNTAGLGVIPDRRAISQ